MTSTNRFYRSVRCVLLLCAALAGCHGSFSSRMINSLSDTLLKQDDAATVRDGAPAYLLLTDGLIADNPEDIGLLQGGAKLYNAYATVFVDDPVRAGKMADKALDYAWKALCEVNDEIGCELRGLNFDNFAVQLKQLEGGNIEQLYTLATVWVGWIQLHQDNWQALAELPKAQAMMKRVLEIRETYDDGGPHLYLGILDALRPASLGGNPKESKEHFERAIELTQGKNLIVKVMYAKYYARITFDRALHDRLLTEVISAEPQAGVYTLTNVLAQKQAQKLLVESRNYFVD